MSISLCVSEFRRNVFQKTLEIFISICIGCVWQGPVDNDSGSAGIRTRDFLVLRRSV